MISKICAIPHTGDFVVPVGSHTSFIEVSFEPVSLVRGHMIISLNLYLCWISLSAESVHILVHRVWSRPWISLPTESWAMQESQEWRRIVT